MSLHAKCEGLGMTGYNDLHSGLGGAGSLFFLRTIMCSPPRSPEALQGDIEQEISLQ